MPPFAVPRFVTFTPTGAVEIAIDDQRRSLDPEQPETERERRLYDFARARYLEGDYGFGLWLWRECDRLSDLLHGDLRALARLLGPDRYFGFSHRVAVARAIPLDRVYRPRKGDRSQPRPEAIQLPFYQLLSVYLVRARDGDRQAQALYEIARNEADEHQRVDRFRPFFERFRALLERSPLPPPPETESP